MQILYKSTYRVLLTLRYFQYINIRLLKFKCNTAPPIITDRTSSGFLLAISRISGVPKEMPAKCDAVIFKWSMTSNISSAIAAKV